MQQAMGDCLQRELVTRGDECDELIAANPSQTVVFAKAGTKALCDLCQHFIADGVAVVVVDLLETIGRYTTRQVARVVSGIALARCPWF